MPGFQESVIQCRPLWIPTCGGMTHIVSMPLTVFSSSFHHNESIPAQFTCDGADIAPQISWSGAPSGTRSFALIVDDPDAPDPAAPKMIYVHWVLYNIPAAVTDIVEGTTSSNLPQGTLEGKNDWNRTGYGGPCPPIGRHRYFFRVYALDCELAQLVPPTRAELDASMKGHVLATGALMGTYRR